MTLSDHLSVGRMEHNNTAITVGIHSGESAENTKLGEGKVRYYPGREGFGF